MEGMFVEPASVTAGALGERPQGSELLSTLKSGDVLVVPYLYDLATTPKLLQETMTTLRGRGIDVRVVEFRDQSPDNIDQILRAALRIERAHVARLRAIKREKAGRGLYVGGRPATGYRRDVSSNQVQPDTTWQRRLDFMRERRSKGFAYAQIAEDVHAKFGIKMSHVTVYRILSGKRKIDASSTGSTSGAPLDRMTTRDGLVRFIQQIRREKPQYSYKAIAQRVSEEWKIPISASTVRRIMLSTDDQRALTTFRGRRAKPSK